MKLALYLFLVACIAAVAIDSNNQSPGYFKLGVQRSTGSSLEDRSEEDLPSFVKRDDANGGGMMILTNQLTYYDTVLYFGSNEQKVSVLVDTGSSDLWIPESGVDCTFRGRVNLGNSVLELGGVARSRVVDLEALFEQIEKNDNQPKGTEIKDLEKRATSFIMGPSASVVASASSGNNECTGYGSFDLSLSSSFLRNMSAPPFYILYADGTNSTGIWGTDSVKFSGITIDNLSFAIANETSSQIGILGVGLSGLEITNVGRTSPSYTYENFPMRLKSEGIINTNAFSLYLDRRSARNGTILFGAVDHAKYSGDLLLLPLLNSAMTVSRSPLRLQVVMSGILIQGNLQNVTVSNTPLSALLDSGTTYTYLPQAMLTSFANVLGAQANERYGLFQLSCNYMSSNYIVTFMFSGVSIEVPLNDLIVSSRNACFLTLFPSTQTGSNAPSVVLGDNFLRSAYIVYDLDNYQVAMAQAVYTDDQQIEIISSTIPLATTAPGYSSTSTANTFTDMGSGFTLGLPRRGAANPLNSVPSSMWRGLTFIMSLLFL